jgi:hypothetical protein
MVGCFGRRVVWRGLARRAFLGLAIAGLAGLAASCGGQSIPANQATPAASAGVATPVHVVLPPDRRGEEGIATEGAPPRWRSARDFEVHYQKHHAEVGVQRLEEYDASARETIRRGRRFEYREPRSGALRVGYFDPETGLFTALDAQESHILTHFRPREGEAYVRQRLPDSTYR